MNDKIVLPEEIMAKDFFELMAYVTAIVDTHTGDDADFLMEKIRENSSDLQLYFHRILFRTK